MQACWRGRVGRILAKKVHLAHTIQSMLRMQQKHRAFEALRQAAINMQARWRAVLAMRAQRAVYTQLRSAAITMQASWRGRVGRIYAKKQHLALVTQSLVRMQAQHSVSPARSIVFLPIANVQNLSQAFGALRSAAISLQASWRGRAGRILAKKVHLAHNIQSMSRMQQKHKAFEALRQAAIDMQARWRAVLAMRAQRAVYTELRSAAITLQAGWRGRVGRIYAKKQHLALVTQSLVRMQAQHSVCALFQPFC